MSAWSDAFAEVKGAVEPDRDPILTYGNGTTADAAKELDQAILSSVRGVVWVANTAFTFGQTVFPLTRMGRRYRVRIAGTSGATEPTWTDSDFAVVVDGTVTLIEDGRDSDSIYDVERAKHKAWLKKTAKASEYLKSSNDDESVIYQRCVEQAKRYAPVGIA